MDINNDIILLSIFLHFSTSFHKCYIKISNNHVNKKINAILFSKLKF